MSLHANSKHFRIKVSKKGEGWEFSFPFEELPPIHSEGKGQVVVVRGEMEEVSKAGSWLR